MFCELVGRKAQLFQLMISVQVLGLCILGVMEMPHRPMRKYMKYFYHVTSKLVNCVTLFQKLMTAKSTFTHREMKFGLSKIVTVAEELST